MAYGVRDPSLGGTIELRRKAADGLEWSYGWEITAAQRMRFLLDFSYATGLRASELIDVTLGNIRVDEHRD
jgi:integrase